MVVSDIMRRRLGQLFAVTFTGIGIGVFGEVFFAPPPFETEDVIWGIIFSPISVTVGGRAVSIDTFDSIFLIGGILFWPVYLGLSIGFVRWGNRVLLAAILFWTAQGFFQIGLRWAMIMSA